MCARQMRICENCSLKKKEDIFEGLRKGIPSAMLVLFFVFSADYSFSLQTKNGSMEESISLLLKE